mmetsp:Transcript_13841/g.28445  ORF Transcript_13841/g.28445 Transcript_13841/m.28445 type:complete len:203 (-) Transcript_13841:1079-1687(-)
MTEAFGSLVLPFPLNPKLRGRSSVARSIISTWEGPGVQVVADVPALGPVPPPYSVVMPLAMASSHCWGHMKWMWVSTPPAVTMSFSPAMTSVVGPTIISLPGSSVTPFMKSGLPALPMLWMRFPLIPMSALTTPNVASRTMALVMTQSRAREEETEVICPIPSRRDLPPPNLHSSPWWVRSDSMRRRREVSPRRRRSPVVGP